MRLIDADRLMDNLRGNVLIDVTPELERAIEQQPAAFDKEKVINDLLCASTCSASDEDSFIELEEAIEIVEKGGIE
jgi:hypothetical protein|uniref:Uncharacterized protein n=1 Tax=Siphoviridae sp. ctYcY12 TaxID=2825550 RepID=A0A8S5TU08_9CAUD|nr:MAG TPA: hypothetical protein [Siphoviridae sp. ctYcY12]